MESKLIKEVIQRIAFECQESGASKWQVLKVIKELEQMHGTKKQLKKKAGEVLEQLNPDAAKTFRSFERLKVFTSKEKREAFDRGNIIKSLIKETNISRAVAEKIGSEVEDQIKDLNIDYLNTQLIREMANVKLLEYGHEPIHSEYARIGMPVFEVEKKLSKGLFENKEILREYNWLKVITKKARGLHFDSLIYLFSPEDFSTKIFSQTKFFEGKKEDILLEAVKMDKCSTNPVTLNAFNYSIDYNNKSNKKTIEEISSINKIFSTTEKRTVELALFNDFEWQELSSKKKDAVNLANNFLLVQPSSFEMVVSVDSKYKLKLLEKNVLKNRILISNNSSERTTLYSFGPVIGKQTNLSQLIGLNLEKILEVSGEKENVFFDSLEGILSTVNGLVEKKKTLLGKRSYLEKNMIEKSGQGISLSGLFDTTKILNETSPWKAAEKIISFIQKQGFILMETPSNISLEKFGLTEERDELQKILLQMNSKQRKNYGFKYQAGNIREAENLLGDCPLIEFIPKNDKP